MVYDKGSAQLGDWGRHGLYNQSAVAAAMGRLAARQRPRFVVNVGDNFYESEPPPHARLRAAVCLHCAD